VGPIAATLGDRVVRAGQAFRAGASAVATTLRGLHGLARMAVRRVPGVAGAWCLARRLGGLVPVSVYTHVRQRVARVGVMAMASGRLPTLIGLSAVLVAIRIGVTVPLLLLAE